MKLGVVAVSMSVLTIASAQQRKPIIDMHMHALAADSQGPPPLGMCTPWAEYPAWDPATPYRDRFLAAMKKPPCSDPVWSPTKDDELMNRTIAIMERYNVFGVLSGSAGRVATWVKSSPSRFIRGLGFQLEQKDTPSPASI